LRQTLTPKQDQHINDKPRNAFKGGTCMNAQTYTAATGRTVSVMFLLAGLVMVILPFALDSDFLEWGGASLFVGLVIFTTSLFLVPFFAKRAAVMARIHRGDGIMAWWQYPVEAWEKERQVQISELGGMKIGGFVLAGIFALIGIIIFATDPDDMQLFLLIMLGIAALMVLASQLSAKATRKRLLATDDEAVIHPDGLFYRGELTTWGRGMNRLKAVGVNRRNPTQLLFCYRQFQRRGDRRALAMIPIPFGQEQVAADIAAWFNRPITPDWQEYIDRTGVNEM
jgi:uncharacterized membrane protein YgdD (TMEM256/DUF423 family)